MPFLHRIPCGRTQNRIRRFSRTHIHHISVLLMTEQLISWRHCIWNPFLLLPILFYPIQCGQFSTYGTRPFNSNLNSKGLHWNFFFSAEFLSFQLPSFSWNFGLIQLPYVDPFHTALNSVGCEIQFNLSAQRPRKTLKKIIIRTRFGAEMRSHFVMCLVLFGVSFHRFNSVSTKSKRYGAS